MIGYKYQIESALRSLKIYKSRLTKQQLKTFKGQILKGDIVGFKKGLEKVLKHGTI